MQKYLSVQMKLLYPAYTLNSKLDENRMYDEGVGWDVVQQDRCVITDQDCGVLSLSPPKPMRT